MFIEKWNARQYNQTTILDQSEQRILINAMTVVIILFKYKERTIMCKLIDYEKKNNIRSIYQLQVAQSQLLWSLDDL